MVGELVAEVKAGRSGVEPGGAGTNEAGSGADDWRRFLRTRHTSVSPKANLRDLKKAEKS